MKADKFNAQINHMHTQSVTPNLHLELVLEANLECFVCVVIRSYINFLTCLCYMFSNSWFHSAVLCAYVCEKVVFISLFSELSKPAQYFCGRILLVN